MQTIKIWTLYIKNASLCDKNESAFNKKYGHNA